LLLFLFLFLQALLSYSQHRQQFGYAWKPKLQCGSHFKLELEFAIFLFF
jgi:hypothetical protein